MSNRWVGAVMRLGGSLMIRDAIRILGSALRHYLSHANRDAAMLD